MRVCFAWAGMNAGADAEDAEDAEGIRERTQKTQKLRRRRKRNTKFVWKRLEAVFMRVAGHKWLVRRMGAGCRGLGILCRVLALQLPRSCHVL